MDDIMLRIELIISLLTGIEEGTDGSELLSKLMLLHVKRGCLTSDVGHLVSLQWRHLLFHCNGDLLCIVPLLRQLLKLLVHLKYK